MVYLVGVAKWCIWLECGKMVYLVEVWQMVYLGGVRQNGVFGWCIAKLCICMKCGKMVYLVGVWQNGVFG